MKRLAVTGGIACGKSFVGRWLKDRYCPTIDCDDVVHNLLATENQVSTAIIEVCTGRHILSADVGSGFIDRKALGRVLFSNNELRHTVETIIHPAVRIEVNRFFEAVHNRKHAIAACLIPLLFETNTAGAYDVNWLVYCTPALQLQRLMKRSPHLTESQALARIDAQMSQLSKLALADRIIDNSGSRTHTELRIEELWQELTATT